MKKIIYTLIFFCIASFGFAQKKAAYVIYNAKGKKTRTVLTRKNTFEGGTTTQREDFSYDNKGRLGKTVFRND